MSCNIYVALMATLMAKIINLLLSLYKLYETFKFLLLKQMTYYLVIKIKYVMITVIRHLINVCIETFFIKVGRRELATYSTATVCLSLHV